MRCRNSSKKVLIAKSASIFSFIGRISERMTSAEWELRYVGAEARSVD